MEPKKPIGPGVEAPKPCNVCGDPWPCWAATEPKGTQCTRRREQWPPHCCRGEGHAGQCVYIESPPF